MNIPAGLVVFAILWFICLFCILPIKVKSQIESGDVVPGSAAGAPENAHMKKKALWAVAAAAVLWVGVYCILEFKLISLDELAALYK